MKPLEGKTAIITGAGRPRGTGRSTALRRQRSPDEAAGVVAYLCGPAAGYLTGVALPIAGGMVPSL
jgi:NAD(P)-dependent dehydrogenase (short-subunit alcohol dehydrogenase family)